jgi:hypothetical protein
VGDSSSRSTHKGAGCGWPHTRRTGNDPRTAGSLRRRPVRVASTRRSARPWAVLPARVDAGRPPQVDPANGAASGRGALPGAAPLRRDQPVGLAAGPPAAGPGAGWRAFTDRVGGGRHRLPQGRPVLGGRAAPVLGDAGQDRQLPARRVGQRRLRAGELPAELAAVLAGILGRRCDGHPASRLPPPGCCSSSAEVAAGVGHAGRAGRLGAFAAGAASRLWLRRDRRVPRRADTREIPCVVEVRSATSAYAEQVRPTTAPYIGKGRRPRRATTTSHPRWPAWRSKPGSRPVWS